MPAVPAIHPDAQTPVTLYVNGEQWWFSVATVRRVGRETARYIDWKSALTLLAKAP